MGSDWIMDPTLHLAEKYYGIIDPTLGSMLVSAYNSGKHKKSLKSSLVSIFILDQSFYRSLSEVPM